MSVVAKCGGERVKAVLYSTLSCEQLMVWCHYSTHTWGRGFSGTEFLDQTHACL